MIPPTPSKTPSKAPVFSIAPSTVPFVTSVTKTSVTTLIRKSMKLSTVNPMSSKSECQEGVSCNSYGRKNECQNGICYNE